MGGEIPVIDLQGNDNRFASKLREACEKWGCFRVVNHEVPTDLMAEIKSVIIDLFDRPVEIKQRNKKLLPGSGYVALNEINQVYEAFAIDVTSSRCIPSFCSDLDASPHQREIIEKYYQGIENLAKDVASKMAESMGLEKDDSFKVKPSHFRMNKYTVTPENIDSYGLTKHTDSSLLTILQDDENFGGLEVVDPSGEIVAVECYPGAFLVLLGDIALPWSNGKLRNVEHRVVCKDTGIRVSIATICTPANDEVIVAHPKFLAGDCQPKYKPFTYEEFRKLRASERLFAGEVLELLRSTN